MQPLFSWKTVFIVLWFLAGSSLMANGKIIRIAFLPSYGDSWADERLIYNYLRDNYQEFGDFEIEFTDVGHPVTQERLSAVDPDVILISDPSGGNELYSLEEKDALEAFLNETGTGLVGTYKFRHSFYLYDNAHLMCLYGIDGNHLTYGNVCTNGIYTINNPNHPVFSGITDNPYSTLGFLCSQEIDLPNWTDILYNNAEVLAETTDSLGVMVVYEGNYKSFFCSTMPDYCFYDPGDNQLIYNAIVWVSGNSLLSEVPVTSDYTIMILLSIMSIVLTCHVKQKKVEVGL